jgi:RNA polymerase sigma-70 factor (ECF subfamily)
LSGQNSDADLVERARKGDTEAFGALVTCYQRLLTGIAFGIMADPGRAEDMVQEAFLAAWKSLPKYRGEASFKNWLCRILVNKSCSALRWQRLRQWLSLDHSCGTPWSEILEDTAPDADPQRLGLREERSAAVRAAVAGLPLQQRTAVALRANGLDVLEVARSMGVAEGTVKAHLHQARARLFSVMEDHETERAA